MGKNSRECAADLLYEIIEGGAYANIALNQKLTDFPAQRDRAFITNLVYGTIRRLNPIDYQLARFLQKPIKEKDGLLRELLRLGFFEIIYTAAKPHGVVNELVNIGKKRGNPGWGKIINGVLRNLLRQKSVLQWPVFSSELEKEGFFLSVPIWLKDLWLEERGEDDGLKLIRSIDNKNPLTLRVNTLKSAKQELMEKLSATGIDTECGVLSEDALRLKKGVDFNALALFQKGAFTIQEEPSQLASIILDPKPGDTVLDMCAAPGGKATHLAQRMENQGEVTASDIYRHKIALIRDNAERLGATIVKPQQEDALNWGKKRPCGFDAVLLDAPCSGLGVLSHRPDSLLHKEKKDIEDLSVLQRELLTSAYHSLKPGGRLLYSTCTLSHKENRDNLHHFLQSFPDMKPKAFDKQIPNLNPDEREQAKKGFLELLPFTHETDGFFIALLIKDVQ